MRTDRTHVPTPHFLEPLLKKHAPPLVLCIDRPSGAATLATTVEAAVDSASRKRGLLGRDGLAPGAALVIAPTNGVHTFFMRFAIDVVFVARDGRVVKIARAVKPWRATLALRAFAVVELAAGAADRAALRVGDRLSVGPG
jgi:uncharacterized membrane protein (UPF0127 family)